MLNTAAVLYLSFKVLARCHSDHHRVERGICLSTEASLYIGASQLSIVQYFATGQMTLKDGFRAMELLYWTEYRHWNRRDVGVPKTMGPNVSASQIDLRLQDSPFASRARDRIRTNLFRR